MSFKISNYGGSEENRILQITNETLNRGVSNSELGTIMLKETESPIVNPGFGKFFCKLDNKPYFKNDLGEETELGGGGSSTSTHFCKRVELDHINAATPVVILSVEEVNAIKPNGRIYIEGMRSIITETWQAISWIGVQAKTVGGETVLVELTSGFTEGSMDELHNGWVPDGGTIYGLLSVNSNLVLSGDVSSEEELGHMVLFIWGNIF